MKNTFKGFIKALKDTSTLFITRKENTVYVLNAYCGISLPAVAYDEFFVKDSPCFVPVADGESKGVNFRKKNDFEIREGGGIKDPERLFGQEFPYLMEVTPYARSVDACKGFARFVVSDDSIGMMVNTAYIDPAQEFGGIIECNEKAPYMLKMTQGDVRWIMCPVRMDGGKDNTVLDAIMGKASGGSDNEFEDKYEELKRKFEELEDKHSAVLGEYGVYKGVSQQCEEKLRAEIAELKAYIESIEAKAIKAADESVEPDPEDEPEEDAPEEDAEDLDGIDTFDVEAYLTETADAEDRITDELVAALDNTKDIEAELIGTWLWVTGNTRDHKDVLKALGFRWSGKKQAWYMSPAPVKRGYRTKYSNMDAVRRAYTA